jgi:hypothetical protein
MVVHLGSGIHGDNEEIEKPYTYPFFKNIQKKTEMSGSGSGDQQSPKAEQEPDA